MSTVGQEINFTPPAAGFKAHCHLMIGPCIRINPWEVHIDGQVDPVFWDVLYSNSNKLDKDSFYYGMAERQFS